MAQQLRERPLLILTLQHCSSYFTVQLDGLHWLWLAGQFDKDQGLCYSMMLANLTYIGMYLNTVQVAKYHSKYSASCKILGLNLTKNNVLALVTPWWISAWHAIQVCCRTACHLWCQPDRVMICIE